jgi:hypothetical protein
LDFTLQLLDWFIPLLLLGSIPTVKPSSSRKQVDIAMCVPDYVVEERQEMEQKQSLGQGEVEEG